VTRNPRAPVAVTEHGALAGSFEADVAVFRGIPFAAPPVGPLRWAPPQPAGAWQGTRPATHFGPAPLQPQPPRDSIMFRANFADRREIVMSEDCLYLNVWTPEPSATGGLPVLVWVHGGGHRFGAGSADLLNGRNLARHGLVVVTISYRLGSLGYLAHPALTAQADSPTSGNYGLLDTAAALRWVQRNISAFGGDPGRVTAGGNSAGAVHVCHLMAAPLGRGLFSQAIGQASAGVYRAEGPMPTLAEAEERGRRFAGGLGAHDGQALRSLPGVALVASGQFGPIVDGVVLAEDTQAVFEAGRQAPVPLLLGSNSDEGSVYARPGDVQGLQQAAEIAGDHALHDAFQAAYPTGGHADLRASARAYVGDTRFTRPVWRWAATHAATAAAPVWLYLFDRQPPLPPGPGPAPPPDGSPGFGAYHTAELPYVWDNQDQRDWPWTPDDRVLARTMSSAWCRFVGSGDPGGGGLPAWGRCTGSGDSPVMYFGDRVRIGRPYRLAAMQLLDALAAAQAGTRQP